MPDAHAYDHWTIDSFNLAALGMTQTSKTSVLREIHAESPRVAIWLNAPGDDRVPGVEGKTVQSMDGLKQALANNHRKIDFLSRNRERDVVALRRYLWTLAERSNRQLPMQVTIDEAHNVAPQSNEKTDPPRDAVRKFAKEGVKRNVKLCIVTQDPTSYDKQALRQSEYRLVFEMSAENQSALSEYGFDWDAVKDGDRYDGTVHKANGTVLERSVQASMDYVE